MKENTHTHTRTNTHTHTHKHNVHHWPVSAPSLFMSVLIYIHILEHIHIYECRTINLEETINKTSASHYISIYNSKQSFFSALPRQVRYPSSVHCVLIYIFTCTHHTSLICSQPPSDGCIQCHQWLQLHVDDITWTGWCYSHARRDCRHAVFPPEHIIHHRRAGKTACDTLVER